MWTKACGTSPLCLSGPPSLTPLLTSQASGCPSTPPAVCESPAGTLTASTPQLNTATLLHNRPHIVYDIEPVICILK